MQVKGSKQKAEYNQKELYIEAQASFSSLVKQASSVFIGLLFLLLLTRGNPSNTLMLLSSCLGVAFVAWHEQKELSNKKTVLGNLDNKIVPATLADQNLYETGRVLVVDDTPTNLFILSKLLTQQNYRVYQAEDGDAALAVAKSHHLDLILLDITMSGMDGYEVCQRLRAEIETAHIPIIFISELDTSSDKVQAFQYGAADYITKPFQPEEVLARVRHQLSIQLVKRQQQQLNNELEARVKERTQLLELAHNQLLEVALIDRLTRLPNRLAFVKRLSKVMARTQISQSQSFAIAFLDCDRFKRVNDSLGHRIGDQLLKEIAHRLEDMRQKQVVIETVARFGGDEFALLLKGVTNRNEVSMIARDVLKTFSRPFILAGHEVFINVSIGLVWGDTNYVAAEHLLRDADIAMYQAKGGNQSQYCWFESDIHNEATHNETRYLSQLETDMRLALERREFELHYQPIIDLERMTIIGFEALVRWQHPQRGLIFPSEFINFAEETGFISALGEQVLEMACTRIAQWERAGIISPEITISVNVAAEQLSQPGIVDQVQGILEKAGVQPHRIRLELTEGAIISNRALEVLQAFNQRDIQLSIDDFGTGYSSLSYLRTLPVNRLNVDRSFVQAITHEPSSLGIVSLIINLAETMNMQVVAEGIENIIQLRQLQKLGCKYGQGYLFQRALPASEAITLLQQPLEEWNKFQNKATEQWGSTA